MPLQVPKCYCGEADVQITCIQCDSDFCIKCDEKTHWNPKLKQHERRPYSAINDGTSQYCSIKGHDKQPLSLFCQTCLKLICGLCVASDHKSHLFVALKEAIETAKDTLTSSVVPMQERITKVEQNIIEIQKNIKFHQEEIKKSEEKLIETKKKTG